MVVTILSMSSLEKEIIIALKMAVLIVITLLTLFIFGMREEINLPIKLFLGRVMIELPITTFWSYKLSIIHHNISSAQQKILIKIDMI